MADIRILEDGSEGRYLSVSLYLPFNPLQLDQIRQIVREEIRSALQAKAGGLPNNFTLQDMYEPEAWRERIAADAEKPIGVLPNSRPPFTPEALLAALKKLGVESAGKDGDRMRWSVSDLATDLFDLLAPGDKPTAPLEPFRIQRYAPVPGLLDLACSKPVWPPPSGSVSKPPERLGVRHDATDDGADEPVIRERS